MEVISGWGGGGVLPIMALALDVFRSSILDWSQNQNKLSFRIWTVVFLHIRLKNQMITARHPFSKVLLLVSLHSFCWFLVSYSAATSYSHGLDFLSSTFIPIQPITCRATVLLDVNDCILAICIQWSQTDWRQWLYIARIFTSDSV